MSDHAARPPRAPMGGATRLLRDILSDLEALARARGEANEPRGDAKAPAATLGDLIDRLDERAFGLVMLLLALPCSIPFVYVLPQIVALPMLVVAGQMAAGRHGPWLPESFRRRSFEVARFKSVLDMSERYVRFVEYFARPRLRPVTGHGGARIIGFLMFVPLISILIPLPATNAVPAAGVAVASLGLIERDGLLVIAGLLISFAWVAFLLFFGVEAATMIKDWIAAHI